MARIIRAKINLSKIDKSRIFTSDKGNKFLDVVIIETPNGKYGDWMISEDVKKEERERGVQGNILGNGKNVGSGNSSGNSSASSRPVSSDDLPY